MKIETLSAAEEIGSAPNSSISLRGIARLASPEIEGTFR